MYVKKVNFPENEKTILLYNKHCYIDCYFVFLLYKFLMDDACFGLSKRGVFYSRGIRTANIMYLYKLFCAKSQLII